MQPEEAVGALGDRLADEVEGRVLLAQQSGDVGTPVGVWRRTGRGGRCREAGLRSAGRLRAAPGGRRSRRGGRRIRPRRGTPSAGPRRQPAPRPTAPPCKARPPGRCGEPWWRPRPRAGSGTRRRRGRSPALPPPCDRGLSAPLPRPSSRSPACSPWTTGGKSSPEGPTRRLRCARGRPARAPREPARRARWGTDAGRVGRPRARAGGQRAGGVPARGSASTRSSRPLTGLGGRWPENRSPPPGAGSSSARGRSSASGRPRSAAPARAI